MVSKLVKVALSEVVSARGVKASSLGIYNIAQNHNIRCFNRELITNTSSIVIHEFNNKPLQHGSHPILNCHQIFRAHGTATLAGILHHNGGANEGSIRTPWFKR